MLTNQQFERADTKGKYSAKEFNRLLNLVESMSRSLMRDGIMDSTGFLLRKAPPAAAGGANLTIFEVRFAGTGDGIYECRKQTLDATEWTDTDGTSKFDEKAATEYSVFNLYENHPVAYYEPALGLYDKISAWTMTDDEGSPRWVGIPLTPQIRLVQATEAAGANAMDVNGITCNLILNDGTEAAALGSAIEVYGLCSVAAANWNAVVPRIVDDQQLTAQHINGYWYFITGFIPTEDCACASP